jgi:hypothetical protein
MKNVFLGSLFCLACLRIVLKNELEEISYNWFFFNMFSLFIAWKMSNDSSSVQSSKNEVLIETWNNSLL